MGDPLADQAVDSTGREPITLWRRTASRWGLYRDLEQADAYLETFIVVSWAEHLRQHERLTRGDSDLE